MDNRSKEVALLAGIVYFIQGALGVTAIALPIYLRSLGWSISEITITSSIVAFPWVFKIVYGLISDCLPLFSYRRKTYLLLFAAVSVIGWLSLKFFPGDKFYICIALILSNLGLAATDVITDGFIVENSQGTNSHIFQSIAWGTRSLGAILSGFTGGWLAQHWNPRDVFFLASFLPLLTILAAMVAEEEKRPSLPFHSILEPFKRCLIILSLPNFRWFLLLLLISQASSMFGVPFFFHMKEKLQFKESFLGALMSLGWTGVVLASIFYAKFLNQVHPKTILRWAILINTLNILSTLVIHDTTTALMIVFLGGLMTALTLLPIMTVSAVLSNNTGVEGTVFAVLMSIHNLAQIAFGFLGGKLFNVLGLQVLILISAALNLLGLYFVHHLKLRKGETPYLRIYKHLNETESS